VRGAEEEQKVKSGQHDRALEHWLDGFQAALAARDTGAVLALFAPDECYWRDLVAFTWNIATMEGREAIGKMLDAQADPVLPFTARPEGGAAERDGLIEGWFDFETGAGRGKGHVRLKDGRCFTLLTALQELKGFEEPGGRRRPEGVVHRAIKDRETWSEARAATARTLGTEVQPYCLVVGGSQGGLALGARLKRLGVPTLIVDALEKPGDAWRSRYKSLYLHDPVWIDHLPYIPFPDHWPVYTAKDKMGDWLEMYARVLELDFWGSTRCTRAHYDEAAKRWTVTVDRAGREMVLRPAQLVLATGLSGIANMPVFPGADSFRGVQCHSSQYADGAAFAGKACVVVGSNNSAHDICVDLWSNDAKVTMIQRSPTTVIKASALRRISEEGPYSEKGIAAGIDTDRADLITASTPFRLKEAMDRHNCDRIRREDAAFYERLAASGFQFDFGEDGTAIAGKYMRRASGYYIDVGGSDLICDGEVRVRSGVGVASIAPGGLVLTDGSEVAADAIIYATGYGPMDGWAEMLISREVAEKVGRCWGLGSGTAMDPGPWEGELRNMWKPTRQEGLWFHGGNLAQSRFHSLHLALQIKARMEGIDTPVHQPEAVMRAPLCLPEDGLMASQGA
jgi:putative flavoprotein involved in K+ transport